GLFLVSFLVLSNFGCERTAPTSDASAPGSNTAPQANEEAPSPRASLPSANAPLVQKVPSYRDVQPARERGSAAPAKRYANLADGACAAELKRRNLPVKRASGKTPGLEAPLQLIGPLRG